MAGTPYALEEVAARPGVWILRAPVGTLSLVRTAAFRAGKKVGTVPAGTFTPWEGVELNAWQVEWVRGLLARLEVVTKGGTK